MSGASERALASDGQLRPAWPGNAEIRIADPCACWWSCRPTTSARTSGSCSRRCGTPFPSADVLVVDDNSPDGTGDVVAQLADELGQIAVLRRPGKQGLGSAYRAGFRVRPRSRLRRRRVDGRRPLPRSRGAPRAAPADRGRRRRRHRVALRPRWGDGRLAVASPRAVALGEPLHVVRPAACRSATARRAIAPIAPRHSRRSTPGRRAPKVTPSSPSSSAVSFEPVCG